MRMSLNIFTVITTNVYRCEESTVRSDLTSKLLAQVKNGVQHLSEKLQHIKMVSN